MNGLWAALLVPSLVAAPPALLAPSVADLDKSLDRVQRLIERAEALDRSWGKRQQGWVLARCPTWACSAEVGAEIVLDLRQAARDMRRFAQSARAEWARADRIRTFDAVRPLVRGTRVRRWQTLEERLDRVSLRYSVRAAWNDRFVEPWAATHARTMARLSCGPKS